MILAATVPAASTLTLTVLDCMVSMLGSVRIDPLKIDREGLS